MRSFFAISVVALAAASSGYAQDVSAEDSEWFAAGQARIQQMLERQPNTNTAKNVILLVADGNGIGTNYATRIFQGQQKGGFGDEHVLHYEAFPYLHW